MVLLGISKWFSGWFWLLTKLNSLPSKIWFPDHHVHKMIPTHFKYQQKKRRYPRKKETSQVPLQAQVSVYFPIDWVHFSFRDMSDSLKVSKHLKIRRKCSSSNSWFSGAALVLGMFRSWKICFRTPRVSSQKKRLHVHRTQRKGHPFLVSSLDRKCTLAMPKPPGNEKLMGGKYPQE